MRRSVHLGFALLIVLQLHAVGAAKTRRVKDRSESLPARRARRLRSDAVCSGFFTVLAEREPWRTRGREPCADTFGKVDPFLRMLSAQMGEMGETLTVFSTYTSDSNSCKIQYPHIKQQHFDAAALMKEYDFEEVMRYLAQFSLTEYTRTSDIVRLLLAHKHGMAYIDPDVHFISPQKHIFFKEFVGAAVWNEVQCSLEMTNSAFCLSRAPLEDLIAFMRNRLLFGDQSFLYAELGPAMFQKVLMNKHAVMLYSQNNPEHDDVADTVAGIKKYNHSMLHITSTIRLFLVKHGRPNDGDVITFVTSVRREAGLNPLSIPQSTLTAEDHLEHYKAFVRNNYFDSKGYDAAMRFVTVVESVLDMHLEVFKGDITPQNAWVQQLSPANGRDSLYHECVELYEYLIKATDISTAEYQTINSKFNIAKRRYAIMITTPSSSRERMEPIGYLSPEAIAESHRRHRMVEERIRDRGAP